MTESQKIQILQGVTSLLIILNLVIQVRFYVKSLSSASKYEELYYHVNERVQQLDMRVRFLDDEVKRLNGQTTLK